MWDIRLQFSIVIYRLDVLLYSEINILQFCSFAPFIMLLPIRVLVNIDKLVGIAFAHVLCSCHGKNQPQNIV